MSGVLNGPIGKILDEDETAHFETIEEAYAALYEALDPGGVIELHEDTCSRAVDEEGPCDCDVEVITKSTEGAS